MGHQSFSFQRLALWRTVLFASLHKLDHRVQLRNPVTFIVYLGSILTTWLVITMTPGDADGWLGFTLAISVWLWFPV